MNKIKIIFLLLLTLAFSACKINYSFTGASISPEVKTFSVIDFPNLSSLIAPSLAPTFNNALVEKMLRSTSLTQVTSDGDMNFEGEIVDYTSLPVAVTGDEFATQNRLTVTVRVKFTNRLEPKNNYDKSFSAFEDYDNNQLLPQVEPTLLPQIVDKLVTDIFNAAASNW